MIPQNETPFSFSDIEDVRVIVKAKGKHYGIVGKNDDALEVRIALLSVLLEDHYVVDTALEDIKDTKDVTNE